MDEYELMPDENPADLTPSEGLDYLQSINVPEELLQGLISQIPNGKRDTKTVNGLEGLLNAIMPGDVPKTPQGPIGPSGHVGPSGVNIDQEELFQNILTIAGEALTGSVATVMTLLDVHKAEINSLILRLQSQNHIKKNPATPDESFTVDDIAKNNSLTPEQIQKQKEFLDILGI